MFISIEEMNRRRHDPANLLRISLPSEPESPSDGSLPEVLESEVPSVSDRDTEDTSEISTPEIRHERCGSGRTEGTLNRTPEERAEIAEFALLHGKKEASRSFAASPSQVNAYANGFNTSGKRYPDSDVGAGAAKGMEEVRQKAIEKILSSISLLNEDKIDSLTPVGISQVALNMSKVHQNMSERGPIDDGINRGNNVQVIVYSPAVRDEDKYKTIEIR